MKPQISKIIKEALEKFPQKVKISLEEIQSLIEIPPTYDMGDFAFPCFSLAKQLKMSPQEIALELRSKIKSKKEFSEIQTQGPYLNFFIDRKKLATDLILQIKKQGDKFGKVKLEKPIKTMIEFVSPNTNKPLHIGHLRNMSIGESLSRISEFNGEKIIRANLNNDRGIHICKSMAAYKLFGKNKSPGKIKSDHFVGNFYSMFGKKEKTNVKLELESHRMLQRWEEGDKETIKLWNKMNKWAFEGWKKTFKKFDIKFDEEYYESKIYTKGRDIILKGFEDKLFEKKKEGAIFINLEKEKLGEKILLRSNGTSVYITQDIYLAKFKFDKFKLNKSYYITGKEQDYHFNVLFSILEKLGLSHEGLKHISYGNIFLPGWKKIKSREGTEGIKADEILENIQNLAKKELRKRDKTSKKILEERSLKIALAAIKYSMLKIDVKKDTIFDPKKSLSFEGNTGPYLQYSYARASSILKKIKTRKKQYAIGDFEQKEIELIKKLSEFSQVVLKSYSHLNPSLIANYSYQLAQIFNEFYHACPVIKSNKTEFRLRLVESFKQVLKNSLHLLGIEVLERM